MASRINVIGDFSIREIFDADIRMVDIQVFDRTRCLFLV